jgi:hypothetical protein
MAGSHPILLPSISLNDVSASAIQTMLQLQVAFRNGVELSRKVVEVRLNDPRVLVSLPASMGYADTLTLTPYQPGYLLNPLLGVITANFGEPRCGDVPASTSTAALICCCRLVHLHQFRAKAPQHGNLLLLSCDSILTVASLCSHRQPVCQRPCAAGVPRL